MMNIFYLDSDPVLAAQYQCDSHVVKMVLESAQLLSSAYPDQRHYKHTHLSHPCSMWTRASIEHWLWLHDHAIALAHEYTHRFGRSHKTEKMLQLMANDEPFQFLNARGFDEPPLCMPDQYKNIDCVQAYRDYYLGEKSDLFRYTRRALPVWLVVV